jgi:DNA modification methylase
MTILHGDCRQTLRTLADCSVDSIVTDPPYELGFMGKQWDASGIAYDIDLWRECLRVLKPGGHLLAFGGTRTYHRMAVAIEDAGFEVRDSIHWLYGSGFPKSLDVSKAIDKQRHDRAEIETVVRWMEATRRASGVSRQQVEDAFGTINIGQAFFTITPGSSPRVPTLEQVPVLLDLFGLTLDDVPDEIRRLLWDLNGRKGQPGENWWKRDITGQHGSAAPAQTWNANYGMPANPVPKERRDAPATDAAKQWDGWGTALKPAHEPIVVARKPLVGTVAQNVLQHGTGALNIDGGRVGSDGGAQRGPADIGEDSGTNAVYGKGLGLANAAPRVLGLGRWPANLVLTHAADCADTCAAGCPVAELDRQSGVSKDGVAVNRNGHDPERQGYNKGWGVEPRPDQGYGEQGGASRFFTVTEWDPITDSAPFRYVAKPGKTERNAGLGANFHPTVKPVDLMRWLVRLVTPPGGTVLDPFLGSGTTAVAAILEGFNWVGCELTDDYLPIIEGRTAWARQHLGHKAPQRTPAPTVDQLDLFGGDAA